MALSAGNIKDGARPLHIAFAHARMTQGGAERAISALAGAFAAQGHRVTLYLFDDKTPSFYTLDSRVRVQAIRRPPVRYIANALMVFPFGKRFRRDRPDVVLTFASRTLLIAFFAALFLPTKVVYAERSNPRVYPEARRWRAIRRVLAAACDGLVFQTKSAMAVFPRQKAKSIVIENAIFNPAALSTEPPPVRERAVASMGRFIPSKGFPDVVEAFGRLPAAFDDYRLDLYAVSGAHRGDLEALIARKGLSARVRIITGDENAIARAARAGAFVFASYREGMPNALLEAMAVGLPCVSYDCEMGPSDLITDGENGFLVPVGDVDALCARTAAILSDPALSARLSKNAMQVRETHSLNAVVAKWLAFIRRVVGGQA